MPTTPLSRNSLLRRSEYQRRCGEQAGVALLITLAALVLLSAVVLAFLSLTQTHRQISFSSSGQNRAEILARTGIDTTMADFISEIQAGSFNGGYTSNSVTIYVPSTNFTAAPYRIVSTTYTNLVTESLGGYPFWTNTAPGFTTTQPAPTRASSDSHYSTLTPSLNGRYIPASIWAKPQLLSSALPTPSWILITRGGPMTNATTLPSMASMASSAPGNMNYVIGRYAYAVYDEGGLIDVNVAGNGLSLAANAQRGRLNQAALGQIPLVDNTPGDTANTNAAYNLVTWRNPTSSTDSANYLLNPTNTFMNVSTGYANQQAFTSRQDLINYFANNGLQTSALPYVGTFSRELNAPGYTPPPLGSAKRPGVQTPTGVYIYSYGAGPGVTDGNWHDPIGTKYPITFGVGNPNSVGLDDTFNPSLVNFRDSNGNPLIKQRFPLCRIAWLSLAGPMADSGGNLNPNSDPAVSAEITAYENAGIPASYLQQGTPANILTYFGLVWDPHAGNNQWLYVSPEGSVSSPTPTTAIKYLKNIPAARAKTTGPDFFETLQSAISVGSIGRDAGPAAVKDPCSSSSYARYSNACGVESNVIYQDQNIYRHILQIGANVIDQYDPDSFPTAILMGVSASPATYTTVFGTENLPYLSMMDAVSVQDYSANTARCFLAAQVWNPHQSSITTITSALSPPTTLRIRAVGDGDNPSSSYSSGAHCYVQPAPGGGTSSTPGVKAAYDMYNESIQFSNVSALSIPTLLNTNNAVLNCTGGAGFAAYATPAPYSTTPVAVYGLAAGSIDTSAINPATGTAYYKQATNSVAYPGQYYCVNPTVYPAGSTLNNFALEYQRGTSFYPYSVARNVAWRDAPRFGFCSVTPVSTKAPAFPAASDGPWEGDSWTDIHVDPRTDRFGFFGRVGTIASANQDPFVNQTRWYNAALPVPNQSTSAASVNNASGMCIYMPYLYAANSTSAVLASKSSSFIEEETKPNGAVSYCDNTSNSQAAYANCIDVFGGSSGNGYGRYMETIADNLGPPFASGNNVSLNYYLDPDGNARPGTGAYTAASYANATDGRPMAMSAGTMVATSQPIILNRPFRSVADLGYTFRDEPWKDLDFYTTVSGDAALLEAFCIDDATTLPPIGTSAATFAATTTTPFTTGSGQFPMVAGKLDLNTQNTAALQAALFGAIRSDDNTTTISQADAKAIAQALVTRTTSTTLGPLQSKADLVTQFSGDLNATTVYASASDAMIKRRREAAIRALSDVGSVRTWNLLIDIVAQAGKYTPTSTTGDQFLVEGERHYWLHVALDRPTAKVIDYYLEPVND